MIFNIVFGIWFILLLAHVFTASELCDMPEGEAKDKRSKKWNRGIYSCLIALTVMAIISKFYEKIF